MTRSALSASALCVLLGACSPWTSPQAGRSLYDVNCASCHGADARGAVGPDLTLLAARNGGVYPQLRVLNKLDGYARGEIAYGNAEMPNFGDLLTGRLTRVDTDRGLSRPFPEKIIALDAYLRQIQR